jgi:hypothetical protein
LSTPSKTFQPKPRFNRGWNVRKTPKAMLVGKATKSILGVLRKAGNFTKSESATTSREKIDDSLACGLIKM